MHEKPILTIDQLSYSTKPRSHVIWNWSCNISQDWQKKCFWALISNNELLPRADNGIETIVKYSLW